MPHLYMDIHDTINKGAKQHAIVIVYFKSDNQSL